MRWCDCFLLFICLLLMFSDLCLKHGLKCATCVQSLIYLVWNELKHLHTVMKLVEKNLISTLKTKKPRHFQNKLDAVISQ